MYGRHTSLTAAGSKWTISHVVETLLKRAGDPNWSAIEHDLRAIDDELRRLKESAVSVLSSVPTKDGYPERKLAEKLKP